MNPNAALPTFRIEAATPIAQRGQALAPPVGLDSPAIEVMTDLTQVKAASVAPGATLAQAELTMIHQGVRMLFVVSELPAIEGLVTTTDLHGDRAMRMINERRVHHDALSVADVMTPLHELEAVAFEALRSATVGNLVATLQRFGHQHVLVVQAATVDTPRRVRGVVSRTQLERQLGRAIAFTEVASSFAEVERALL